MKKQATGLILAGTMFLLSACGSTQTAPGDVTEAGYPTRYAEEREQVFSIDTSGEGVLVTISKGKLVETIDPENMLFIYYGEMKDAKPDGYGLVYTEHGSLQFGGEFKKGEPSGYGIVVDADDKHPDIYEADHCELLSVGGLQRFRASGTGFAYDAPSFLFEGPKILYTGELTKNERDGEGTEYYLGDLDKFGYGPLKYDGEFKDDEFEGSGELFTEDGSLLYEGEFKNGQYHGDGTLYDEGGSVRYEGQFKNGEIKG